MNSERISKTKQILIVDDEPSMVRMTMKKLQTLGYEVTGFTDPGKALELIETDPRQFDLMITDMIMPGLNGAQLARKVLKLNVGLPIILCSAYSTLSQEDSARLGFKKYMAKPVNLVDLALAVEECLAG